MHFNGLTDKQVEESRKKYGSNVIPDSEPTTFWAEFKETFKDPMIRILLAIAALMIVMCVLGYAEIYEPIGTVVAVLIVAFVSAKTGVASDTKYRQLKDSTKKDQCKVYRNGLVTVIDVDDVVVGDKVLLQSGDKVPADGVLIPIQCEYFALEGVSALMGTIQKVQKMNRHLAIEGVVLTMLDARTNLGVQVAQEVRKVFKNKVYQTVIPRNVRLGEAPSHGLPISLYDPRSLGAQSYQQLAKEFLARE